MLDALYRIFAAIDRSAVYHALLFFYGAYPIAMSVVWILMSLSFRLRQERADTPALEPLYPVVSVIVPAFEEEKTLAATLDSLLAVDYPCFEVIVVDDGSRDDTADVVRRYIDRGPIRLLRKRVNEGKAMALNDALPLCRGEILVILDADILVTPGVLRALVPHFQAPRVAAVTGNPRVLHRTTLLENLQAAEFSAIISMQRRSQRIWGRVMTVSGCIFALRRTALLDAGGFSPGMATEDIDLTWRVQMRFWDVRYEPRAVVWMEVPPTLRELWKQRRRWARGLAQVLKRHRRVPLNWKLRRLWPVWYESWTSIAWAYTFVLITSYWILARLLGHHPYGASPIPNFWGMMIATACLVQLLIGALNDRRYDPKILRSYPEAIYYPLIYWMLMSAITCLYTLDGLLRRPVQLERWKIARRAA